MDIRLEEYDAMLPRYRELESIAAEIVAKAAGNGKSGILQVAHRIKTRDSVLEKMLRKPEKYPTLLRMTDILGFRIICYFADQVDEIAQRLAESLTVDRQLSTDKRASIAPDAFGYLSLHYICLLPQDGEYPEDLKELRFEIQIRSALQHTWAEIEHDLGYKTRFGVPRDVRREFSRVAGLLELADEAFIHIKQRINDYQKDVYEKISNDNAASCQLDLVTLKVYLSSSHRMTSFTEEICRLSGATIIETNPEEYLEKLDYLGVHTLGDLSGLLESEQRHALHLANEVLGGGGIEELLSTVGLYYLCRARLVYGDYDSKAIAAFFRLSHKDEDVIRRHTEYLLKKRAHAG